MCIPYHSQVDLSPHGSSALDPGVHHWITNRTGSLHD